MSQQDDMILELIAKKIETDEQYRNRILNALISSDQLTEHQETLKNLVSGDKTTPKIAVRDDSDEGLFGDLPPLDSEELFNDLPPLDPEEFD